MKVSILLSTEAQKRQIQLGIEAQKEITFDVDLKSITKKQRQFLIDNCELVEQEFRFRAFCFKRDWKPFGFDDQKFSDIINEDEFWDYANSLEKKKKQWKKEKTISNKNRWLKDVRESKCKFYYGHTNLPEIKTFEDWFAKFDEGHELTKKEIADLKKDVEEVIKFRDAENEAKAAKQKEYDEAEAAKQKIEDEFKRWALANCDETIKLRIEEGYNWKSEAEMQWAKSIFGFEFELYSEMECDDSWKKGNASLEDLKELKKINEIESVVFAEIKRCKQVDEYDGGVTHDDFIQFDVETPLGNKLELVYNL